MDSKEVVINKVVITPEAKFDYKTISEGQNLSTVQIRKETEEYLKYYQASGRLSGCRYFRVKYFDDDLDRMLLLFFYKGKRFGTMQLWNLAGICYDSDYDRELEDRGMIRFWLMTKLDLEDRTDWVELLRIRQEKEKKLMEDSDGY